MTAPVKPIAAVDVPAARVAEQAVACRVLAEAAAHTESPSDRIAYAFDQWLITHPDTQLATDADYPTWAAELASRPTYYRAKEATA